MNHIKKMLNRIILLAMLLGCLVPLLSCQDSKHDKHKQEKFMLAKVNDEQIYLQEFKRRLAQQELELDEAIGPVASARMLQKETLLSNLIDEELLLQRAKKHHIVVSSKEIQQAYEDLATSWDKSEFSEHLAKTGQTVESIKHDLQERLSIAKFLHRQVFARVIVTDDEIKNRYEQDPEKYNLPEMVRARQIIVKTEEQAHEVLGAIKAGMEFSEAAMKYSLSPDAHRGGDLGFFARGSMPKVFEDVCFSLAEGKVSDIVSSEYGYHIFQVSEKKQAQERSLDDVRENIEMELRLEKEREMLKKRLAEYRERAKIIINKRLFESI